MQTSDRQNLSLAFDYSVLIHFISFKSNQMERKTGMFFGYHTFPNKIFCPFPTAFPNSTSARQKNKAAIPSPFFIPDVQ